jgi:hypothetical protein
LRGAKIAIRIRTMMKLRYVLIAASLLVGCRKEPSVGPGSGGAPSPPPGDAVSIDAGAADAGAAPDAGGPADAAVTPAQDTPAQGSGGPAGGSKGTPGGSATGDSLPGQGQACAEGKCAAGLSCVEYYGIAGPRGPKFSSCEIRCGGGGKCPGGQTCVTIADGPGQVCRKPNEP